VNQAILYGPSKGPRYRQVLDDLQRDLASGKYKPGQKLPSEAALGKRFRTSRITIGRALRELKQRGLVEGVAGSGNFVRPASAAGGPVFGLLIPNLGETDIFDPICRGMASAPEAHALLWGRDLEGQVLELCRQFIEQRVSGVFFAPVEFTPDKDTVNERICSLMDDARIPMVLLDRDVTEYPRRSRYDLVGIDNRRAGYLATEHLLALGCRDVSFLGISGAAPTVSARIAGFREALIAHGVALDAKRIQLADSVSAESIAAAWEAASSKAVVCANDRIASALMRTVPRSVRVVGMDDVDYAALLPVPLTTIHQPCREIGQAAVAAMMERIKTPQLPPRQILLDCHLIVRESSGG
jgi:GntR family transcriptional regulator of arabinose operon